LKKATTIDVAFFVITPTKEKVMVANLLSLPIFASSKNKIKMGNDSNLVVVALFIVTTREEKKCNNNKLVAIISFASSKKKRKIRLVVVALFTTKNKRKKKARSVPSPFSLQIETKKKVDGVFFSSKKKKPQRK
jgi:hypothetical protein